MSDHKDTIDLRSDTVTRPDARMRAAMAAAEVGDDVYGEDPTVNRLQALCAERLGHEAGVFVPSGTQGNLLALLTHCQRGDEFIAAQSSHTYRYEGGGGAVLGGIQPQPILEQGDGTLDLDQVAAAVKPADFHFARSRLLCLENTFAGRVLSLEYLQRAAQFARDRGLALHLDGARIFNASVASAVPADHIGRCFYSVSCCLSKGLGAPVGSVLCGRREFVEEARRWRKMAGGGMRQAGILAAAGVVALEHNVERLAQDHANADRLAAGLAGIEELAVDSSSAQTNMVFVDLPRERSAALVDYLRERGVLVIGRGRLRLVTHLDVTRNAIDRAVAAFKSFFEKAE